MDTNPQVLSVLPVQDTNPQVLSVLPVQDTTLRLAESKHHQLTIGQLRIDDRCDFRVKRIPSRWMDPVITRGRPRRGLLIQATGQAANQAPKQAEEAAPAMPFLIDPPLPDIQFTLRRQFKKRRFR
jgi:hypothetical protein